jgi:hypothetical protein
MDDVHQANNDKMWSRGGALVEKYAPQIVALAKAWREKIGGRDEMEISKEDWLQLAEFASLQVGEGIEMNGDGSEEE